MTTSPGTEFIALEGADHSEAFRDVASVIELVRPFLVHNALRQTIDASQQSDREPGD